LTHSYLCSIFGLTRNARRSKAYPTTFSGLPNKTTQQELIALKAGETDRKWDRGARKAMNAFFSHFHYPIRILVIIAVVIAAHLVVVMVRKLGQRVMVALPRSSFAKMRTISSLLTSIVIFILYFGAVGLVLKEFGVSLTAYLASASVLGLAIGFGSQGLVQDVVTGLTLIFSDLVDIDDMVEISGQTGIVQSISMRFLVLKNHLGAQVFIPNRTITSVINYPRGYIRCLVDITLSNEMEVAEQMIQKVTPIITAAFEQFTGIFITQPSTEGRFKTHSGKEFLRIKFRIWPGRGSVLETTLKQEIVQTLKALDPAYADWMVSVSFEVEKKSANIGAKHFQKKY
jgi:small conductance mechanosensitive channel